MPSEYSLSSLKIGFIGAGNMAHGMVKALLTSGTIKANQITMMAPSNNNLPKYAAMGCNITNDNQDVLPGGRNSCDVVFLCVKPANVNKSLIDGQQFLSYSSGKLILVSILAGVQRADVARAVGGPNLTTYRIMTNTACALGAANCAVVKDDESTNLEADNLVIQLTSTFGEAEFIAENLMNAFSGVAGCGIAFGYTFIQAMADGAVKMGIPRKQAIKYAAQTIDGACRMVLETGKHPIELRDNVCSPGGSTIVGVHALERNAVTSGIIDAVEASTKRTSELSK